MLLFVCSLAHLSVACNAYCCWRRGSTASALRRPYILTCLHLNEWGFVQSFHPWKEHEYVDIFDVAFDGQFFLNFNLWSHARMSSDTGVARWLSGRASDLRSKSRGLEARPQRYCVTTLGKLFTPYCLCHQAVWFGTSESWEVNRHTAWCTNPCHVVSQCSRRCAIQIHDFTFFLLYQLSLSYWLLRECTNWWCKN